MVKKSTIYGLCFALLLQVSHDTAAAQNAHSEQFAYGADVLQNLDFWHARSETKAPLILFVHGGGWKRGDKKDATGVEKVEHFVGKGYAFASINYRLVPNATVEQQASDVAAAIAWVRNNADKLGIDPSRIVLMGHSAGAHLAALVGTDPQYLKANGVALSQVQGVVAIDGACYDVPRQIDDAGRFMRNTYLQAFGSDPARQRALSPTAQAAAPNAPAFLIAHINRADGKSQSEALAAALNRAGTPAEIQAFDDTGLRGHMQINRALGRSDYPFTAIVDTWLANLRRSNQ